LVCSTWGCGPLWPPWYCRNRSLHGLLKGLGPAPSTEKIDDARIRERYRRGYAKGGGLGEEFEGWEDEGVEPET